MLGYTDNGLADFIEHGTEGILVRDAAAMIESLTGLLHDQDELAHLHKTTRAVGPSITEELAIRAVNELYRRAQPRHLRVARPSNR